jgi:NAD(P)-dependent dehydrogenase (short-subunit alcohol dehydrogenase family)
MSDRLKDKITIVTGASRGIGEAIAMAFAKEGAKVVLASRKQEPLDAVAEKINAETGGRAFARACHIGKAEQIDALLAWVEDELGLPDVLVNNAATNPYFGPMIGIEDWAFDKTFEVNLKGPFELTRKLALRWMGAERAGAVVNVASIAGLRAAPLQGVYGMTKAALISMTQTLAVELGPAKIRVNAIAPGLVETKFAAALTGSPEIVKIFTDHTALKRFGQPEEIAPAAIYLASDESAYVTGQTLCVDAGYTVA